MDEYFSQKLIDCTKNGQCSMCGGCCSSILPITDGERRRIVHYVQDHGIQLVPLPAIPGNTVYLQCPFMDTTTHKCRIYTARPNICRSFLCNRDILQNMTQYIQTAKRKTFPRPVNMWTLFNHTGIIVEGVEITPDNRQTINLSDDNNIIHKISQGQAVQIHLKSKEPLPSLMCLQFGETGMDLIDTGGHIIRIEYEDIDNIV